MFLVAFLLLAPADDLPADDEQAAAAVLDRWEAANRGVTSVRATYRGRQFDHAFQTVTLTEGEFHHDPAVGTLITIRPAPAPENMQYESGGIAHRPTAPAVPRRWYWDRCDGLRWMIDDARHEATRLPAEVGLFGTLGKFMPETAMPFAPGHPYREQARDWSFSAVRRTADDVFLSARPRTEERAENYSRALLWFRRSDWSLRGVKLDSPSGGSETMYLFEVVAKNPSPPPRPALEGYIIVDPLRPRPADWQAVTSPDQSGEPAAPSSWTNGALWLVALRFLLGLP